MQIYNEIHTNYLYIGLEFFSYATIQCKVCQLFMHDMPDYCISQLA